MTTTRMRAQLGIGLATVVLGIVSAASPTAACVVGTGTSASCSQAAFDACLPGGGSFDGTVTFSCGGPKTIIVTTPGGKVISANTTIDGAGGITINGNNAVRVFSVDPGITFTVQHLTIANGNADSGGGISNAGTLVVTNSTFSNNNAVSMVGSNSGAIFNTGTLASTNSTFSGNSADLGGVIYNSGGTVTVINSTFSGNSADQGGGIYLSGGTVTVTNTIIAQNPGGNCANGAVIDAGHNLEDADTCGFSGATCAVNGGTSFCNTPPGLAGTLADNGGPTRTLALLPGSAAINNADSTVCAAPPVDGIDQRGFPRDSLCDIGAFEVQPGTPAPVVSPAGLLGLAVLLTAVGAGALSMRRRARR